ncbi:hypothetical protein Tsubulata_008245 [Turnera subulata]|uniref:Uncharacterized protein n=1 Tax=Turnera subulata TaxID=218843 RepID=A0A9Q0F9Z3_9ROSI|nr:hypothetical protein Tsubulata_008245 [Turnera subulata]
MSPPPPAGAPRAASRRKSSAVTDRKALQAKWAINLTTRRITKAAIRTSSCLLGFWCVLRRAGSKASQFEALSEKRPRRRVLLLAGVEPGSIVGGRHEQSRFVRIKKRWGVARRVQGRGGVEVQGWWLVGNMGRRRRRKKPQPPSIPTLLLLTPFSYLLLLRPSPAPPIPPQQLLPVRLQPRRHGVSRHLHLPLPERGLSIGGFRCKERRSMRWITTIWVSSSAATALGPVAAVHQRRTSRGRLELGLPLLPCFLLCGINRFAGPCAEGEG